MVTQSLNGRWTLNRLSDTPLGTLLSVPGSVYKALEDNKLIMSPYYGENQYAVLKYSESDYAFSLNFGINEKILSSDKIYLRFGGIDTVSEVFFNGISVGKTNNMHRTYEFDVTDIISREGTQNVTVNFTSPVKYIKDKNKTLPLWGVSSTMEGYPHIRKAHFMYGWDWGPVLPDMGIWKDVTLIGVTNGRIDSIHERQSHSADGVLLKLSAKMNDLSDASSGEYRVVFKLTAPDKEEFTVSEKLLKDKVSAEIHIENPALWYPVGYGKHPLYRLTVELWKGEERVDSKTEHIGLRQITVSRTPDGDGSDGEEFAFIVNGIKIFAMGANYIPEDQIICKRSRRKTEKLLSDCLAANYNMIRVWGGGFYPDDYFYDFCDRNGLLVWQDFMFACSVYSADRAFCENVKHEIIDNVKRIRNHPCLAMWCGNNETESAWQYWGLPDEPELKKGYLVLFEALIPKILDYYDPDTFYWPSSPSSGGGFNDSGAKNKGDIHFWEVWHSCKPISDYTKYLFRFCSEYGFESIPEMKTVLSFAKENDLDLSSPVMEAHQKCAEGNGKLLYYIGENVHYPYTFESLIYASQLIQAESIKLAAEHMRRHRGVCMGSLYWQVNDSNPVISWSSIDYFGRWKALHYYAKKFYAPMLLSADLTEKNKVILNISSELTKHTDGKIIWKIRKNTGEILCEGSKDVIVNPLSAKNYITVDLDEIRRENSLTEKVFKRYYYLDFSFSHKGAILSSASCLFGKLKEFKFLNPDITSKTSVSGNKFKITISAKAFAKGVRLSLKNHDAVFSDNWFDLCTDERLIFLNKSDLPDGFSENDIANELIVSSYYDEMNLSKYESADTDGTTA